MLCFISNVPRPFHAQSETVYAKSIKVAGIQNAPDNFRKKQFSDSLFSAAQTGFRLYSTNAAGSAKDAARRLFLYVSVQACGVISQSKFNRFFWAYF